MNPPPKRKSELLAVKGAKTPSFRLSSSSKRIESCHYISLRESLEECEYDIARILLHDSADSSLHDMVIAMKSGYWVPPHKHADKAECYHSIEGRVLFFEFDEVGNVNRLATLGGEDSQIYRIEPGTWHAVLGFAKVSLFHESRPGPFPEEGDSLYPDWQCDLDRLIAQFDIRFEE